MGGLHTEGFDGPAVYRIRVRGRLGAPWRNRLGGLEIVVRDGIGEGPPTTELSGLLADQAALMGVLTHLYTRGIPLLSVECVDPARD